MTSEGTREIAVTGVAARFPGGASLDDWWTALVSGQVLTTRYDRAELLAAGVPSGLVDDPNYVPVRGHLGHAEHFDNRLFAISPRESRLMDPQHRLMLEVAWSALEDAGVAPLDVPMRTAVFASATGSGYLRAFIAHGTVDPATLDDLVHGTEPDFMASRIAYKLGLTGAALAVQTACSSSLVAVHLAVRALLADDCDQALVVASGYDYPQAGYLYMAGGVQSASGRCRPFDESADGVVSGSGVAAVVLRRHRDVTPEDPQPYGLILGTAVNNDGGAKAGYYAPSATGQRAVIEAAVRAARIDARSIGYLEAHGTGTSIGDPIEWSAASVALTHLGARPGQVALGALKANIGHLDAAAGLAGLIKTLFILDRGVIPPLAEFRRPNPLLELDGSPLRLPSEAHDWIGTQPRRAGVSAFGIGGTNAHVIVERAVANRSEQASGPDEDRERLLVLSAADPEALDRSADQLATYLESGQRNLDDVSATLAASRAGLRLRLAVTGRTGTELAKRLRGQAGVAIGQRPVSGCAPAVLLFPGQGSQHPGMARPYRRVLPGFDAAMERCLAAFPVSLSSRVRAALLDIHFPAGDLDETELAQPALFALGWSTATALAALGVRPVAVAGHSLGEITAACVAGAFDLAGAAAFVTSRGAAMQACPPGEMLALGCELDQARRLISDSGLELEVSSVNGPASTVVAGTPEAVAALLRRVGGSMFARRLRTTRAFHSRLIEPAMDRLVEAAQAVPLRPVAVPIFRGVDGGFVDVGEMLPATSFANHARRPVRLDAVLSSIGETVPGAMVLDLGPGRALSAAAEAIGLRTIPLGQPAAPATGEPVLTALGTLWTAGYPITLPIPAGRRTHLPGYPFAGRRWLADETVGALAAVEPPSDQTGRPADPAAVPTNRPPMDPSLAVRRAWADLLGYEDLTDDSDFFQLGGDSLLITRLVRRLNSELGVRVPIRAMLAGPTLGRQAALVRDHQAAAEHVPAATEWPT